MYSIDTSTIKNLVLGISTIASLSNVCFAIPSAYSISKNVPIVNTSSAALLRDSEDESLIWVQPSNIGYASFESFSPSANINNCTGVKNLQLGFIATSDIVKNMALRKVELQKEIELQQIVVDEARRYVASISDTVDIFAISSLEDQIRALKNERNEAMKHYEETQDQQLKKTLYAQIKDLKEQINAQDIKLNQLTDENRDAVRKWNQAKEVLKSEEVILDDFYARITKFDDLIFTNMKNIREALEPYAMLHGGDAHLEYDTGWSKSVAKLQSDNPNLTFRKIQTAHARIFASIPGTLENPNMLTSLPAILDYTFGGMSSEARKEVPNLNLAVPEFISGSFALSLIGACPIYFKDFTDETGLTIDRDTEGRPIFGISISYMFPQAYNMSLTAKYNMYNFYEKIHKKGQKGGYFSRKNYEEMIENDISREDFTVDWKIEDPSSAISLKERLEIEKELKASIISRALNQYGSPDLNGQNIVMAPAGDVPKSATQIAAEGMGWCRWGLYCRIATWSLRNLSVFFNNSSSSSFRSTHNKMISESFSSSIASWTPGFASFKKQKEN
ncbi:MAG: hypothetical protein KBD78_12390 [Oligoflexales bacterium]|nr:hypothetical protein [Oligoflexales bacterium]